jgi:hypothetical protein
MRLKKKIILFIIFSFPYFVIAQNAGTSAVFSGTDDYLSPGGPYYQYNTFTTEFWAYADDWTPSSTQMFITQNQAGSHEGYKIELRAGDIRFYLSASGESALTISTTGLEAGWHHIAATYDGSEMNLWLDGIVNSNTLLFGNVDYGSQDTRIGIDSENDEDYIGYIDEIRFWNTARSQAEIQEWMHKEIDPASSFSALRGYYKLNTPNQTLDEGNGLPSRDLTNEGCTFSDNKTPIGAFPTGYRDDPEALWYADNLNWTEESDGLSMQDYNIRTIGIKEFYAFASNGSSGTSTSDLPSGLSIRASSIWFVDCAAADRVNLNFDLSDFGASSIELAGVSASDYKLLRRTGISGDFSVAASGTSISSGEIYFEDYDFNETDAYFTIGRSVVTPSNQATNIVFSGTSSDETTLNWTRGDGDSCAVFMYQGTSGTASPVDDNYYSANNIFMSGEQIGSSGWYCVYRGTGTSETVTGLSSGTDYRVHVCEFNIGSILYNTNTASGNPANISTTDIIYVNYSTGSDGSGDGSSGNPYKSFYKAYTEASDGDTIDLTGTFDWSNTDETGDIASLGYVLGKNLTIRGQGVNVTVIQAASTEGTADRRVFSITSSVTVTIENITIRYGKVTDKGGGIYVGAGSLSLTYCEILSNSVSASSGVLGGGGIYVASGADLETSYSTISGNLVFSTGDDGDGGGGIYNYGSLIISNSTVSSNTLTLSGLNGANGGGVFTGSGEAVMITNSTICNNIADDNSSGFGALGGGIAVYGDGGITLKNSTISGNELNSSATLGAGLFLSLGTASIKNTIIANNTNNSTDFDYVYGGGTLVDNGYNIIEYSYVGANATGGFNNSNDILFNTIYNNSTTSNSEWTKGGTTLANQSLNLSGTLADNGGPTQTLAISAGSFAIGAGLTDAAVTTDQRGETRLDPPTIGGYEYNNLPPTTQAYDLLFSSTSSSGTTVSWTRGNGDSCAVFMYQGTSGVAAPDNDIYYEANTVFGSGDQCSNGWYCVYRGTGTSVTVTGLSTGTDYRVHVCEFNIGSILYNTNTASGNPANISTTDIIYVNYSTGSDGSGDGSSGNPYKSFHKAYTEASDGDTIDLTGTFDWSNADETGDTPITGYSLSKNLTIRGQGSSQTFIQAASTQGSASSRVFTISSGFTINIKDVNIRYGNLAGVNSGGGIFNEGTLNLENIIVSDNNVQKFGGGIYSTGTIEIESSSISSNSANDADGTGGLGGGIYTEAELIINNSTISSNSTNSGLSFYGTKGGGIYSTAQLTITNSTISNNQAINQFEYTLSAGGGIWSNYIISLENVTVVSNTVRGSGGGIWINSVEASSFKFCTFAENIMIQRQGDCNGGGIWTTCDLTIKNTLLANNYVVDNNLSIIGNEDYHFTSKTLTDDGYNIVEYSNVPSFWTGGFDNPTSILYNTLHGTGTTTNTSWTKAGSSLANQNLSIATVVADNGGPTQTLRVNANSFAVGSGVAELSINTDQRGETRLDPPTIGAYENLETPGLWTGATDTDWHTASNWDDGSVPGNSVDVTIPDVSGTSNTYPGIFLANASCKNITIESGASLDLISSYQLDIYGNLENNGTCTFDGTVAFKADTVQSILGDLTIGDMIIDNLLYIDSLATCTISAGSTIQLATGSDYDYTGGIDVGGIRVGGKLVATGSSSDTITFTRQGSSGNWGCIVFDTLADGSSSMSYCKVEYANWISSLVTGATSTNANGAISFVETPAGVIIDHCKVSNNFRYGFDFNRPEPVTVRNSLISHNTGPYGLYSNESSPDIFNNEISYNSSVGLRISGSESEARIIGNLVHHNTGRALYIRSNLVKLYNNTVVYNTDDGIYSSSHTPAIYNCIVWRNGGYQVYSTNYVTAVNCCIQGGNDPSYSTNCITDYPDFTDTTSLDYSLQLSSPCINTGKADWTTDSSIVTTDFIGNSRIFDGTEDIIDMGCYEYQGNTVYKPETQATNVQFSAVTAVQMDVSWTRGDGDSCIVFMYQGSTTDTAAPIDNTYYGANTVFMSGDQIGTSGWYCVYRGTGTSVTVTGLTSNTTYRVHVCEFNHGSTFYRASASTGNPANQETGIPGYWTGATSTDWNTATNWDDNTVPTSSVNVLIRPNSHADVSRQPTISSDDNECADLTIENGTTITINSNRTLTINGDLIDKGGAFDISSGSEVQLPTGAIKNSSGETKLNLNSGTLIIKGDIDVDQ